MQRSATELFRVRDMRKGEKWLVDGRWDIQLWADNAKPINDKVCRLWVKVPTELVGEAEDTVSDTGRKEWRR